MATTEIRSHTLGSVNVRDLNVAENGAELKALGPVHVRDLDVEENAAELKAAFYRSAREGKGFDLIDAGAIAVVASKAFREAKQAGKDAAGVREAMAMAVQDMRDSDRMVELADGVLEESEQREGIVSDILLGAIVPAILVGLVYGIYRGFGISVATSSTFVLSILFALTAIWAILVSVGRGRMFGWNFLGILNSTAVARSSGAMVVGSIFLITCSLFLLKVSEESLNRNLMKLNEAVAIVLAASKTGTDVTRTQDVVNRTTGVNWIEVRALSTQPGAVLAHAHLPTGEAEVRFGSVTSGSVTPASFVVSGLRERPYAQYVIGKIILPKELTGVGPREVVLSTGPGSIVKVMLPEGTLLPPVGSTVVAAVTPSGRVLFLQPVDGVIQKLASK
jgi:hypothetical protein